MCKRSPDTHKYHNNIYLYAGTFLSGYQSKVGLNRVCIDRGDLIDKWTWFTNEYTYKASHIMISTTVATSLLYASILQKKEGDHHPLLSS